jgi:hypothetical protein
LIFFNTLAPNAPLQAAINLKESISNSAVAKTHSFDRRDKLFAFPFREFLEDYGDIGSSQFPGHKFDSEFLALDMVPIFSR